MARSSDTVTFNPERYRKTVDDMRARREEVHERGRRIYEETGELDRLVNIMGSRRLSHNSFERREDGLFVLTNGIALPVVAASDGTGSMAENLKRTFAAMGVLDTLLKPIRTGFGYNTQIATGVAQDVIDRHPVAQMSQFETDERIAEQIRLLIPDGGGGDEIEDYQYLLGYAAWATDLDAVNFYGLKGYFFLMADQVCREEVRAADFQRLTGLTLPGQSMTTASICRELAKRFHTFYLQVGSYNANSRRDEITAWWEKRLGRDRVVVVPDPDFLAELETALIYVTETEQPTKEQVVKLLVEGTKNNKALDRHQAEKVWGWITDAGVPFGAQAKLRAKVGCELPKPGDTFAHFRHAWPTGHPKAGENVTPSDDSTPPALPPAHTGRKPIDWKEF